MDDNNNESTPKQPQAKKAQQQPDAIGLQAGVPDESGNIQVQVTGTPNGDISASVPAPRIVGAAVGDGPTDGSFFSQLTGVPIDYLIATPLISTARANMALAEVMTEFIDELGFESDGKTTRIVSFQLTRPYQDPVTKAEKTQTITVNCPLLGLVPIPSLLVQTVTVDLTVEISNTVSSTSNQSASTQLQVGANWGWGNASFTGSYSCSSQQTRSTNQSAKYEVTVNAQQQPTPEGMSRLMDVMASCITPIPTAA
jgi:hypothetical protein